MAQVDTGSYGIVQQPAAFDAFSRAMAGAQQARAQQESIAGLREQRDALAEERRARAAAAAKAAADQAAMDEAIRQGGGVRGATLAAAMKDAPHTVPSLTKFFDESEKSAAEIAKLNEELNTKRLDHYALTADEVLKHGIQNLPTALAWHAQQFPQEAEQIAKMGDQLKGMSPEQQTAFLEHARSLSPAYQARQDKNRPQVVASGALVDDTGKVLYTAPERVTKPASVQEYEFAQADREARGLPKQSFGQYQNEDANRRRSIVNVNDTSSSDVKEAVAGMKDGTLPPQMPGRASKEYTKTMAEAHRQGYDLQGAVTDWNATQKHIATMNGAQQLRLTQAINSLPEMLDSVDALASKWKGGKFPLLNSATLKAAKGGLYGAEAASIATQLDAQIADVTADLGVVYMGGNSPTDHGLGLAGKSLQGNWDEKVLHDMVGLARKNVGIRKNSVTHTGVAGASPNNPYGNQGAAPAAAAPLAVEEWVRDPKTGKLTRKGGG